MPLPPMARRLRADPQPRVQRYHPRQRRADPDVEAGLRRPAPLPEVRVAPLAGGDAVIFGQNMTAMTSGSLCRSLRNDRQRQTMAV